jgi:hypothetical protein
MGYQRLMGYGVEFPAHQLGGPKKVWDFGVYGLSKVWVKTGLTVVLFLKICRLTF